MNFWTIPFLVFCSFTLSSFVQSFNINSAEVQGDGKEETKPAKEGTSVTLRCQLTMGSGEEWSFCEWQHILKGQYDSNNKELNIQCAAMPNSQGTSCANYGGSDQLNQYASRIKMDVSMNYCGLIISDSKADDNGQWDCRVKASGTEQFGSLDLYMTNHSRVRMYEPDAWAVQPVMIKYDLTSGRPEIKATCRGYGGRPQPTFNWYVNDDRHQINKKDYTPNPIRTGTDSLYGAYVEETISFMPSHENLCREYGLESVCRTDVFTFNLICKTDQGSFYQKENTDASSQALVEVRGGAVHIAGSVLLLVASFILTSKFS